MSKQKPTLYILIGPPGVGKSTWRAKHLAETTREIVIVSSDDIIDAYAFEHGISYTDAFREMDHKDIKQSVNQRFQAALDEGVDVIVDRTNMTTKGRRSFLSKVPKRYHKVAVVFQMDRSLLNERLDARAKSTGKFIPESVVDDMLASYEAPEYPDFDEIIMLVVPTKTVDMVQFNGMTDL